MRVALDTNILAYAEGFGDARRCAAARDLVARLQVSAVLLPAQTLGELYRVMTGKGGVAPRDARTAVMSWADAFEVADSTWFAFQFALDPAVEASLSFWDALVLAVAAENRCRMLLSEDLQPDLMWRGVTVVNPFAAKPHPWLEALFTPDQDRAETLGTNAGDGDLDGCGDK